MKIIALDFECANTYAYYSIFWTGIVVSNEQLEEVKIISKLLNPTVKSFFVGKISFPYTIADLKKEPTFKEEHSFLTDLLDNDTLVIGHAINNDIAMLLAACRKFDITPPEFNYIDTNILYSVYKNSFKDTSLKTIADEFGIEYAEHDPSEDARATLNIVKALADKENTDINGLLDKYGIVPGKVKNWHAYKTYSTKMSDKIVNKMQYINSALNQYDNAYIPNKIGKAPSFHIDSNIFAQFDNSELLDAMAKNGDIIAETVHIADYDVKFTDRALLEEGKMSLHSLYNRYSLDYDLNVILRKNNIHEYIKGFFITKRNVELLAQFREVLRSTKVKDNALKCRRVAISKAVEKFVGYDKIFKIISEHNGRFTPYINQANYFVIYDNEELEKNPYSCKKITGFLKQKEPKIRLMSYDEFNKM